MTDTLAPQVPTSAVPQERLVATEIPGPRSRALHERRLAVVPTGVGTALPVYIDRAHGAILVDVVIAIGLTTSGRLDHEAEIGAPFGGPSEVGRIFLTDHLLAFEITSIVLLVAAVGGVILGSERTRKTP